MKYFRHKALNQSNIICRGKKSSSDIENRKNHFPERIEEKGEAGCQGDRI
jgi:hypothetical protein